jgi:hypothetical protein
MTFREKLAHVAKDDPDFARSARNWRIASWVFGVAVVAALGFAGWSLAIGFSNSTKNTKIESPCLKYGAKSDQCKEAFEQAVLTITHAQACAILRKAGLEIQPCAHARLRQESGRRRDRAATKQLRAGGDAPTGSTGTLQPGRREGGPSGEERDVQQQGGGRGGSHGGGNGRAPAPAPEPADPQTVPPASSPAPSPGRSSNAPGDPEPEPSSPGTVPSTVEAAGGAVKEAGEGVGGAVEGVGKSVDCAMRGEC